TAHGPYSVDITPERAGWRFSGLKVLQLPPGETTELRTGQDEVLVLPLSGACAVEAGGRRHELAGRPDVFTAVTDYLYLPIDTAATVTSLGGATVALPAARATRALPVSYQAAGQVRTELRGAGQSSRQVNNY